MSEQTLESKQSQDLAIATINSWVVAENGWAYAEETKGQAAKFIDSDPEVVKAKQSVKDKRKDITDNSETLMGCPLDEVDGIRESLVQAKKDLKDFQDDSKHARAEAKTQVQDDYDDALLSQHRADKWYQSAKLGATQLGFEFKPAAPPKIPRK
jgi:hypothetical protein